MTFICCSSKKTIVKGTEKRDLFEPKEYKNILTEKLTELRQKRLKDLINTEKPVADNSCIDLDNKIYIYNNLALILGLIFIIVAVILFFASYPNNQ